MSGGGESFSGVVVLGGGAVGLATALALVRRGTAVLVVAPRKDDRGASAAAGAMIDTFGELLTTRSEPEADVQFALEAQRRYPSWLASLADEGAAPVFFRQGMVVVANGVSAHDRSIMNGIRAAMSAHGEAFEDLEPERVPGVQPNHRFPIQDALLMRSALSVEIPDLLAALRWCLEARGKARFLDGRAVSVQRALTGEWSVTTDRGDAVTADRVAVCAGAFSLDVLGERTRRELDDLPELFAGAGASCIVQGGPALEVGVRTPNRASACGLHCLPRAASTYLGASNYFWLEPRKALDGPSLGEISDLVRGCLEEINTGFRKATVIGTRFGLRPVSSDGRPWLGESSLPGLHFATGTHRTGVHLAPLMGDVLAAGLCGEPSPWRDTFAPRDRRPRVQRNLASGVRAMIDVMVHPGGQFPYSKDVELGHFVAAMLEMALFGQHAELRERLSAIHERASLLEDQVIMRMFYETLRAVYPHGGPYPQ